MNNAKGNSTTRSEKELGVTEYENLQSILGESKIIDNKNDDDVIPKEFSPYYKPLKFSENPAFRRSIAQVPSKTTKLKLSEFDIPPPKRHIIVDERETCKAEFVPEKDLSPLWIGSNTKIIYNTPSIRNVINDGQNSTSSKSTDRSTILNLDKEICKRDRELKNVMTKESSNNLMETTHTKKAKKTCSEIEFKFNVELKSSTMVQIEETLNNKLKEIEMKSLSPLDLKAKHYIVIDEKEKCSAQFIPESELSAIWTDAGKAIINKFKTFSTDLLDNDEPKTEYAREFLLRYHADQPIKMSQNPNFRRIIPEKRDLKKRRAEFEFASKLRKSISNNIRKWLADQPSANKLRRVISIDSSTRDTSVEFPTSETKSLHERIRTRREERILKKRASLNFTGMKGKYHILKYSVDDTSASNVSDIATEIMKEHCMPLTDWEKALFGPETPANHGKVENQCRHNWNCTRHRSICKEIDLPYHSTYTSSLQRDFSNVTLNDAETIRTELQSDYKISIGQTPKESIISAQSVSNTSQNHSSTYLPITNVTPVFNRVMVNHVNVQSNIFKRNRIRSSFEECKSDNKPLIKNKNTFLQKEADALPKKHVIFTDEVSEENNLKLDKSKSLDSCGETPMIRCHIDYQLKDPVIANHVITINDDDNPAQNILKEIITNAETNSMKYIEGHILKSLELNLNNIQNNLNNLEQMILNKNIVDKNIIMNLRENNAILEKCKYYIMYAKDAKPVLRGSSASWNFQKTLAKIAADDQLYYNNSYEYSNARNCGRKIDSCDESNEDSNSNYENCFNNENDMQDNFDQSDSCYKDMNACNYNNKTILDTKNNNIDSNNSVLMNIETYASQAQTNDETTASIESINEEFSTRVEQSSPMLPRQSPTMQKIQQDSSKAKRNYVPPIPIDEEVQITDYSTIQPLESEQNVYNYDNTFVIPGNNVQYRYPAMIIPENQTTYNTQCVNNMDDRIFSVGFPNAHYAMDQRDIRNNPNTYYESGYLNNMQHTQNYFATNQLDEANITQHNLYKNNVVYYVENDFIKPYNPPTIELIELPNDEDINSTLLEKKDARSKCYTKANSIRNSDCEQYENMQKVHKNKFNLEFNIDCDNLSTEIDNRQPHKPVQNNNKVLTSFYEIKDLITDLIQSVPYTKEEPFSLAQNILDNSFGLVDDKMEDKLACNLSVNKLTNADTPAHSSSDSYKKSKGLCEEAIEASQINTIKDTYVNLLVSDSIDSTFINVQMEGSYQDIDFTQRDSSFENIAKTAVTNASIHNNEHDTSTSISYCIQDERPSIYVYDDSLAKLDSEMEQNNAPIKMFESNEANNMEKHISPMDAKHCDEENNCKESGTEIHKVNNNIDPTITNNFENDVKLQKILKDNFNIVKGALENVANDENEDDIYVTLLVPQNNYDPVAVKVGQQMVESYLQQVVSEVYDPITHKLSTIPKDSQKDCSIVHDVDVELGNTNTEAKVLLDASSVAVNGSSMRINQDQVNTDLEIVENENLNLQTHSIGSSGSPKSSTYFDMDNVDEVEEHSRQLEKILTAYDMIINAVDNATEDKVSNGIFGHGVGNLVPYGNTTDEYDAETDESTKNVNSLNILPRYMVDEGDLSHTSDYCGESSGENDHDTYSTKDGESTDNSATEEYDSENIDFVTARDDMQPLSDYPPTIDLPNEETSGIDKEVYIVKSTEKETIEKYDANQEIVKQDNAKPSGSTLTDSLNAPMKKLSKKERKNKVKELSNANGVDDNLFNASYKKKEGNFFSRIFNKHKIAKTNNGDQ